LKGTYLLILRVDDDLADLAIGRLGRFHFAAGYYLYIGSAFGPGGLAAQLQRFEQPGQTRPWRHIDYLRPHARLIEAWGVGCVAPIGCHWARALAATQDIGIPVPHFSASNRARRSHLLYVARRPTLRLLTETLLSCFPQEQNQDLTLEIRDYND